MTVTIRIMSEEDLVIEIKVSLKRNDQERWRIGDLLVAQPWITEERIEGIAEQVDLQPQTLKIYREVAREFPDEDWRNITTWGVLEKLRMVKGEKDRRLVFEQREASEWTTTTMANAVNIFLRKKRIELQNKKREARGLPPVDEAVKAKYLPEKAGCQIYGYPVHVNFSKPTREVTFEIDVPLEDTKVVVVGGRTIISGIIPLPDVDEEEL